MYIHMNMKITILAWFFVVNKQYMKRNSSQYLIPATKKNISNNSYDIYPAHVVVDAKIEIGYKTLANRLAKEKIIILDGYIGVDWKEVITSLISILEKKGLSIDSFSIMTCLKPESEINSLVEAYLGGNDPVFGRKTTLRLNDYFDKEKISAITSVTDADIKIIYGTGASQSGIDGFLVYFELPKNELQYRMRADSITNLGLSKVKNHKQMYKHFYFVDWVVLNEEKKIVLPKINIIVDQQRQKDPTWMTGNALRNSLSRLSKSYFRVRPWFEPGIWGGQWMKERFSELNQDVPNYAWSFEMIVPENGLVFEKEGVLLEVSFDMLMFQEKDNVLGKAAKRFQHEFPIRFDFLDTFQGGNLSLQCHPKPDYIEKEFGENFTQDETYYILDAGDDAEVYLGFQDGINPTEFEQQLQHCYQTKEILDVEKFVQKIPAKKHDLFLIPHGTIHCSGINNMVLEISATPYIFTFKMYDWQRMDLDGNPRPLNIKRAIENLDYSRQGNNVQETLISKPIVTEFGNNWKKIHLPTHPDHFYEIYRYEFKDEIIIKTLNQCHILMLVEGTTIQLELLEDSQTFNYAETFSIPAATGTYKLLNKGDKMAKVIVSFVKEEAC